MALKAKHQAEIRAKQKAKQQAVSRAKQKAAEHNSKDRKRDDRFQEDRRRG